MHLSPTGNAFRQLAELGQDPDPSRWRWDIVRVEASGRLVLPTWARTALGIAGQAMPVYGVCNRVALVLHPAGPGAAITVDRRGRLCVPMWLRRATAGSAVVLVGCQQRSSLVVVAPIGVLDGLGDLLAGEPR
jgi:bifunctional DNA-binding transcriptional regulator/antitoxin component of YhaV-PrlF toxin-antitoxin module